ncbi:lantibiotic dehydratase [Streptosporangium canum]|uniref:lantibiotic dehydratase n=1 Tax=Streptosporangium canum TaxID=324952 RepID=UPI0033A94D15
MAGHLAPLGRTGWSAWRDVALRGAGFPARRFLEICDEELAAAADSGSGYPEAYAAASERLNAAIGRIAADGKFREAVAWQSPQVVRFTLDKAAAGESRANRSGRRHELTIATYLQRYCLKNDTVGFFGPFGWARVVPEEIGIVVDPGTGFLSSRTTYFEDWAIGTLADTLAGRPEVWPWLRPRRARSASLTGGLLRRPFDRPVTLTIAELRVLARCDGRRTVREIVGDPPVPATVAALLRLREVGAIRIDLSGPLETWPERTLAARIEAIADPSVRDLARLPLEELVAARDGVAAAGDAELLMKAQQELADTFERLTGREAGRRSGGLYAGRTLVYQDTVRSAQARIGDQAIATLAAPLGLLLDSASWLVNTVGDRYAVLARQTFDRESARTGREELPLLQLLTTLMPELGQLTLSPESEIVHEVVAEFQEKWARILGLPSAEICEPQAREHQISAADIADQVALEFPAGPPRWSGARWFSPDLMLIAPDAEALARGEAGYVLGELHCAANTIENRSFVSQHPDPGRLREAMAATHPDGRLLIVPRADSPLTTSRMSRAPELMLPSNAYLSIGVESADPPPGVTLHSIVDLFVTREGEDLVVRHRQESRTHPFLEAAGDLLTALTVNSFRPLGRAPHRPRVTIDRLVMSREAWTFPASEPAWAALKDESSRYAAARLWRLRHGLPERGFVRVPSEKKPLAVDFRSLPMVNLLAKLIRRTAESEDGEITLTEMLPDVEHLWLPDADGELYTAELRLITVRSDVTSPEQGAAGP